MNAQLSPIGLTEQEEKFLYHIHVLGFTPKRAAELCEISNPYETTKKPAAMEVAERLKVALRTRVEITKEDVIAGFKKAIDQADLLGEPMSQIAGWREISKMLGFDAPKEINITLNGDVKAVRKQIAQLSDAELVKLVEADTIIDGQFYPVDGHDKTDG